MPFDGVEVPLGPLAKFDQVIDLIAAPGQWIKYTYRTSGGRFCLKEALNAYGIAEPLEPIILKAAEERMEREFCCVESFNDHPLTAREDVIAVLHQARRSLAASTIRWNAPPAPAVVGGGPTLWRKLFRWS